ncbi:hypothetical protein AcV5_004080 [Taiwanofungus camphoratus]|nr:hypothetical protein AcV5_004080 [Antrodia cinnamomea]
MSTRQGKLPSDLKEIFEAIQNILIDIKPRLNDSRGSALSSICGDLQRLAVLAESFTSQRPRSNKDWVHLADTLDREGVNLWNASALIREVHEDDGRAVFAALRFAGFRLIQAGLEQKPATETLIHVLQLASKAGASLSEIGNNDSAASVLACAAKYEEALRNAHDSERVHTQAKARATLVYYSCRMEAAWREGNDGIANYMLQKITEKDHLALLLPRDRELLAAKLLQIGKSLLRGGSRDNDSAIRRGRIRDSIQWMQKAFAIIEQIDETQNSCEKELKWSILRSLARAYFLSSSEDPENLSRAEATLNELIKSIDASADCTSVEYQQLRWMRIAVLKRRKATEPVLLDAFRSIIDHMTWTDANITDVLQELRTLNQDHSLVTAVHQHCFQRGLELGAKSNKAFIDRLLLSLIFHCSKDGDHPRAMQDIANAFACVFNANFELSKTAATACVTLLWQFGDRQYNAKHWSEAAEWFLQGTHPIFEPISSLSSSKCFRKSALCYIQQNEYAKAATIIRRCSDHEAATHYVVLLTAVRQGLEDEAVRAVTAMVKASDFNRRMLMLATQLANEAGMQTLLLSVLEALLDTLRTRDGLGIHLEAVTLVRCIIRLVLKLMGEPGSDSAVLIPILIRHFSTARTLLLGARQDVAVTSRDISWLWRTAYNCAIQGCSEWENSEERIADLFDVARQLLELYSEAVLTEADAEVYNHIINASFAAVVGRAFATRQQAAIIQHGQAGRWQALCDDITSCKQRIRATLDMNKLLNDDDILRAKSFLHVLRVFETEVLCQLKQWKPLLNTIGEITSSDALAVNTFEAVADILWVEKDCPVEVLFTTLEAILHASLDRSALSVDKFSRWLRAICTILLSRNTAADRIKAIGYVEQAVQVLEDHSKESNSQAYPLDERQWLLGTAYNTGIECLHASMLDEAKRWFETSTTICRYVPDGDGRAEKISETYTQLLNRYAIHSEKP